MKPPIIYTLLGCTVEIAPGGRTAKASRPGGESRSFTSVPNGASAQVQAHYWVHGREDKLPKAAEPVKAKTDVGESKGKK